MARNCGGGYQNCESEPAETLDSQRRRVRWSDAFADDDSSDEDGPVVHNRVKPIPPDKKSNGDYNVDEWFEEGEDDDDDDDDRSGVCDQRTKEVIKDLREEVEKDLMIMKYRLREEQEANCLAMMKKRIRLEQEQKNNQKEEESEEDRLWREKQAQRQRQRDIDAFYKFLKQEEREEREAMQQEEIKRKRQQRLLELQKQESMLTRAAKGVLHFFIGDNKYDIYEEWLKKLQCAREMEEIEREMRPNKWKRMREKHKALEREGVRLKLLDHDARRRTKKEKSELPSTQYEQLIRQKVKDQLKADPERNRCIVTGVKEDTILPNPWKLLPYS